MAEAQYSQNHLVNPQTGFLESPAYPTAFDSDRKKKFLELYQNNGLGFYRTCKALGLSHDTVNKHYKIDPEFKRQFDLAKTEYGDELESISRINALNPRSVIERIFQLKSLFPEKYADQRNSSPSQITINIDSSLISDSKKRLDALEAEIIITPDQDSKMIDNHGTLSASKE